MIDALHDSHAESSRSDQYSGAGRGRERAGASRNGIPDVRGRLYAVKKVQVVGTGHPPFNALLDLRSRKSRAPRPWAIRRTKLGNLFGGGKKDRLPERGRLGARMRAAVEASRVELITGFSVASVESEPGGVADVAVHGRRLVVDQVVAATGYGRTSR